MTAFVRNAILDVLEANNGGPGLTVDELVTWTGIPRVWIRESVARLVFDEHKLTCDKKGRYRIGSPDRLLVVS